MAFSEYFLDGNDNDIFARGNTFPDRQVMRSAYKDLYGRLDIVVGKNDTLSVSGILNTDKIGTDATIDIRDEHLMAKFDAERNEKWDSKGLGISYKKTFSSSLKLTVAQLIRVLVKDEDKASKYRLSYPPERARLTR